jgi:hypothetical protein
MHTLNLSSSSLTRLIAIVAMVVAMVLGIQLGRQATVVYRLRREVSRLEQVVIEEENKATALQARKAYVLSDVFVEEWARTVAKLTQPGEVRVIIQDDGQLLPETLAADVGGQTREQLVPVPYWVQWWELLFSPVPTWDQ